MKFKYLSTSLLFLQTLGHFSDIGGCGRNDEVSWSDAWKSGVLPADALTDCDAAQ